MITYVFHFLSADSWRCLRSQSTAEALPSPPSEEKRQQPPPTPSAEETDDSFNEWDVDEGDADKLDSAIASLTGEIAESVTESTLKTSGAPTSNTVAAPTSTTKITSSATVETIWSGPQFPMVWLADMPEPESVQHSISDAYIQSKLDSFLREQEGADLGINTSASKGKGKGEEGYEATPGGLKAIQRFQAVIRRCPRQGVAQCV
jgi:hypothetical protein